MIKLEAYNLLWAEMANHIFTQEELDEQAKEHPNFYESYYLQKALAERYKNDKSQQPNL